MNKTKKLLMGLTERYPPAYNRRHGIMLDGSTLTVSLSINDRWQKIYLDENDFDMTAEEILVEIEKVFQKINT